MVKQNSGKIIFLEKGNSKSGLQHIVEEHGNQFAQKETLDMYNKFEVCIFDFSHEREPGDYWYDCAVVEATEILKQFNDDDWEMLLKQLKYKSLFWQKRLVECLGDLHNTYELEVILNLINIEDEDLFVTCIDSLRFLNLSLLSKSKREQFLSQVKPLSEKSSPPIKRILEEFIKKYS
ncbi:hypothetical protein ABEI05_00545 [Erwinia billingiae]|uniref:hypothetical protein n=1 Tax=Erwinia billingiae TaxID=182337 RepID=UPI0032091467